MGLAERKAIQAAKDTDYKAFETKVQSITGATIKLDFDWSAVENHKECMWIMDNKKYNSYMLDRVIEMLTKVCSDDMGKSAVKESLKEIKMIPSAGDVEFAGGVLTIRNDLTGNGAYDADSIRKTLEKGL